MNFKIKILSILVLLSLNCFAMETGSNDEYPAASPKYQKLASEAQVAAGIPLEKHYPIKKVNQIRGVVTVPGMIGVNEKDLNKYSYGVQRCQLFHEAIHVKYDDAQRSWDRCHFKSMEAPLSFEEELEERRLGENRADIEGYNATQCFSCVNEMAKVGKKGQKKYNIADIIESGYLTSDEITKIAENLKQQNKKCTYHSTSNLKKITSYISNKLCCK
ncbi:hypothetical protein M1446_02895 [Candidatus Dependentiae bacterium]|nr:hypothetical protein [Candidatus Dependentiae bacterium]